ncbi:hypothetical protein ACFQZS_05590 [Mucilaginibacter calamicampi]|uniref:Uncharacterized protein n=1 Tax=Mucilaginibacter calamicampi TaxID=1302352 RepID=A0ABW2YT43_9SPHI
MKTLLKLLIPTLVPYYIFARYTALDEAHKHITEQLTEISLNSLMYYFRYVGLYLYVILFLTQYVIILPIWNRLNSRLWRAAFITLLWVLSASLLLSAGVSYAIWDSALGNDSLYRSIGALFGVQGMYWLINVALLFIIDLIIQRKARKDEKQEA